MKWDAITLIVTHGNDILMTVSILVFVGKLHKDNECMQAGHHVTHTGNKIH